MPSASELLVLLIAILVLWIVLKLAKLAIKVIFFLITIAVIAGVLWLFLSR
ncbi:MAG TPA: hypothetical protein VF883_24825 [Thermoanaerobaculia bacterium]|jgi:hypothetical protein